MIQRFVKKLPGVLQTEVQQQFYSATFDQLFNSAAVEQAQGFIGRRGSEILDPDVDNYLSEPTKNRAAYQLEPIAYAVNAALQDTNQYFYEDIIDYLNYRGGNTLNHDRLFADLYYSFAPPIDYDKFLNYQNYLWLEDGGPIVFIQYNGSEATPALKAAAFDLIVENSIIGATTVNTSSLTSITPNAFDLSSGMRVQFEGSASYDRPYWVEGVGRSIRLVAAESNLLVIPNLSDNVTPADVTIFGYDGGLIAQEPIPPGALIVPNIDHTIADYITVERSSCEGSHWTRTNRWMHEDAVDSITLLGQILGGTVRTTFEGIGYLVGQVVRVNIGDGADNVEGTGLHDSGSFIITAVLPGGIVDTGAPDGGIAVFDRGQGYSFATVDQTGATSPSVPMLWDSGTGEFWDIDNSPFLTVEGQTEVLFDNVGDNGTFFGGTLYANGEVLTMSDGSTITVDLVAAGVITEFTITTRSTTPFAAGTTHTVVSSTLLGNDDFTLTTDVNNEIGVYAWDDSTLTSGAGAGLIIDAILASAVSRSNKGTRPILEFKRDLELYQMGNKYIGEVNVVAATEAFTDVAGQAAGLQVDGITLVDGMRLIFLDPASVPLINEWDDDAPTGNPGSSFWDTGPWELDGALGAVTRFIWQVDLVTNPGVIELLRVDITSDPLLTGPTVPQVNELEAILVAEGQVYQTQMFFQEQDITTSEFYWVQGQDKNARNVQPLFELYDTDGISLADTLEYPASDFAGNELYSYKVLTQERLIELGGSVLVDDPILGFPIETKALRQLGDILFENDMQVTRVNYTPVGGVSTEANGYYFFKLWDVSPTCEILTEVVDFNTVQTYTYETNWKGGILSEELRIIDRYLTTSDTEDTFPISGVPVELVAGPANYVVTQGRRLNTDEYVYLAATQEMKILKKPTVSQILPWQELNPTYQFTEVSNNLYVYVNDIFQVEGVDYTLVNVNTVTFLTIPTAEKIIRGSEQESGAPGINEVVEIFTYTFDPITDNELGYFEIPNELENNPNNLEITENSWNEFTPHYTSIITEQASYLGTAFGSGNNYRDTIKDGSLGNKILHNQSPLLKTMLVSQEDERDMIEALRLSSSEYTRFKNRYVKTALQLINEGFTDFNYGDTIPVSQWVDEIIRRVTRAREYGDAFKDTYMIAWNNVYTEQTTTVSGIEPNVTLTDFVDLEDKRNALYVYIGEDLLQVDTDYNFVSLNPIQIKLTATFASSTPVITRLYEDSAPAYIPATPSKLGMYAVCKPAIVTDSTYGVPTDVILGHDGSKTPTYGDERDNLLIELENRIYNGILEKFRVDYEAPLVIDTYKPGKFRETRWTLDEWNDLIKSSFFKWASQNKADYITNGYYDAADSFTWNYASTVDLDGATLPGYWRAIYDYYYDTQTPATTPWEMLGFKEMPTWWASQYGLGPWPAADLMWVDIEAGTILGEVGSTPVTEARYTRTGLVASYLPVTMLGAPQATPLLAIDPTGSLTNPTTDEAQLDYVWTDLAPVEYAWTTSESYPFAVMEALYLARPSEFGEQLWDPEHNFNIPIRSTQIVNDINDVRERIGNSTLVVHGETVSTVPQIKSGYQVWIANRLRALKKDLTVDFGDLIRSLDVKLGHKMASFTDADTLKVFVEGISVSSLATNLLVPTENIDVALYTGPPVHTYMYSGVLIKSILVNNAQQYQVFGYDLLSGEFEYYPRVQGSGDNDITVGGKPASFRQFETGESYSVGQIAKLNGIFYTCTENHTALSFENDKWLRLNALPIQGGVSVTHKKRAADTRSTISYGHKFSGIQEVFDFLIGYGEAQAEDGWGFDTVDTETNVVADWLSVAKDYMFWVATQWEQDSVLMLSPSAQLITLNAVEGYPANVEKVINGVYTILDKNGVVIDPINTTIGRVDRQVSVTPNIEQTGIYALRAITRETENILTFDNVTAFNDTIYDPKLGSRLSRVDFNGRRTLDWTGKLEAAGFIITADGLLPNYENLVNSIRNYHNTEELLDNPTIESVAQHLIGFEDRDYFTDLGILDDAAYQFYQGMVKEKGTTRAIEKMERNRLVTDVNNELTVIEEWALKLDEYAGVCGNQFTEFKIDASEVKVDPQLVQLSYPASQQDIAPRYVFDTASDVSTVDDTITIANHAYRSGEPKLYSIGGGTAIGGLADATVYYIVVVDDDTFQLALTKAEAIAATPTVIVLTSTGSGDQHSLSPWSTGTVDAITVLSATNTWLSVPLVFITNHPDDTTGSGATATAVLDTDGTLLRIDMLTGGTGYTEVPRVFIGLPTLSAGDDRAIASLEFDIVIDLVGDDVIVIDVDDETRWITKPDGAACNIADELWPATTDITYSLPNSGYVHLDDIDFQSFSEATIDNLASLSSPPSTHGQTIHVARDARESFGVYFMDNYLASTVGTQTSALYDGATTGEGTFFGGTGYVVGEDVTLSDGTVINVTTESGNVVTGFTVQSSSTSYFPARGVYTLTTVSSTSSGNDDFTLTPGILNQKSGGALATGTGATLTQTPVITDDGQVTLSSQPREDVIEATLTIDVDGTGGVTGVTVTDGGLGYTKSGSFTISDLTHGAERSSTETDAVISYSVDTAGQMVTPTITTAGTGYTRNVATVAINAVGTTYSLNDILTVTGGGTGVAAQFVVEELSTIIGDSEAEYDATGATEEGTFSGGNGHANGDVITMTDGTTLTVDVATGSVISEQTEANFDNSPTTEGTFTGGANYVVGDLMTMTDGSVVQVTAGAGAVTGFTITSDSTTSVIVGEVATVLILPASGGTGFTMTLDEDNVKYPASFGEVTAFTILSSTTTGIPAQEATITQASTVGVGTGFALNLGIDNQGVFDVSILNAGAYTTVLPSATGEGTSALPAGGTGCLVDLTFIGVGIPVNTADVSDPEGYLRYLGNEDPGTGKLYINNTLYDYVHISGLNYTLSQDGTAIDDEEFAATSPAYFTLANLRFRTVAERTVFNTHLALMGVTQVWTDSNSSGLWETSTASFSTPAQALLTVGDNSSYFGTINGYEQFNNGSVLPDPFNVDIEEGTTETFQVTTFNDHGLGSGIEIEIIDQSAPYNDPGFSGIYAIQIEHDGEYGFDIDSASLAQQFDASTLNSPFASFGEYGFKLYVVDPSTNGFRQYTMTTAFDTATASFDGTYDIDTAEAGMQWGVADQWHTTSSQKGVSFITFGTTSNRLKSWFCNPTKWDVGSITVDSPLQQSDDITAWTETPNTNGGAFFFWDRGVGQDAYWLDGANIQIQHWANILNSVQDVTEGNKAADIDLSTLTNFNWGFPRTMAMVEGGNKLVIVDDNYNASGNTYICEIPLQTQFDPSSFSVSAPEKVRLLTAIFPTETAYQPNISGYMNERFFIMTGDTTDDILVFNAAATVSSPLVLNTTDIGAGGDLDQGGSTAGSGYYYLWFPDKGGYWNNDDRGSTYIVSILTEEEVAYTATRTQEELIETHKFVNAFVYEADTKDTLALIPVYDPFKGIIPGNADLNIKYRAARDPSRYTTASTAALVNEDQAFDGDQVGEVWWDTSTCAYLYYEQDTDTYRRDNWGALFNGSSVDIYEWTRATTTPATYDGDGTVRNTTDYVELQEWDVNLEEVRTFYYYWVKDRTVVPGVKNRTIAGFEVANIITNPTANLYQWFSPISQTGFMFAGVDNVFTDSDNIFQINYRRQDEELPTHVEWELGRENDPNYVINDVHWDKMVDSICGYTDAIAIGASTYTDTTASFETDATSVITAAPGMIVAHVVATFVTDVTGVNAGTNRIGTVAAHGLTTGDPVVYSTRYPGLEDIGLTDGTTYYVNVASATTFSLHITPTLATIDSARVTLNVSGAETHAFCSQAHGLTDTAEVTYSTVGGTVVALLVDAEQYFVEVITPTALALHSTRSAAVIGNPGTRVNLTPAGTPETHTLTEAGMVLNNFNNAIPTAADPTLGYLIVPDPNISEENQLGIRIRPLQSMFLDILGVRRVFVDKVNDLVETIILRDENPVWNSSMTTNNLWEWVDWYDEDYDETNAIPIRQVTDTSDLALLLNPLDGDIVKVTGTRWALYAYDIDSGLYELIGREAGRLNLLATIYEDSPSLGTAIELRELILALQTQVFINDRAINNNLLFFALLNYVFSEQDDIDWAFKTTYIFLDQTGQILTQDRVFQDDPFDSALDYIDEAKPYQTKIRDFRITRATENDEVNGTATETARTFDISMVYDAIRGGDLSVTEMRIAKVQGTLSQSYKGYSTLDAGATLVRLGAAGRFVNNQRDALADIALIVPISDNLADYDPGQSGPIPTLAELEAVATINAAMTTEFFFDYQGSLLQNTSFGGLPTLESAVLSAPGTGGYLVGDILELDAGGGVPISPAIIRVDTVSGAGIATFSIINGGSYQQTPTSDPVLLIGGSGNGDASLTTLIYENGSSVPHDTTPWDQIGFESSVFDTAVTTLDGLGSSPDDVFAAIPAEETFSGNGIQKEFELTTTVPTFFMFVVIDGVEQTLNVDYFFIGTTLTFVSVLSAGGTRSFGSPPAGTNNIELYTYIEAGDLINPQVRAGVTEEMVPLDPRENLIVIADTTDIVLTVAGTGYAVGETLAAVGGVRLQATIVAQTQADFNGTGSNGTFTVGADYLAGDILTMRDQSTVTVNTVTAGAVATFTITTASGKGFQPSGTLVQDSIVQVVDTEPKGSGFTLTTDTNNEVDFGLPMTIIVDAEAGNVITGFTVLEQGDYFTYPTNPVAVTDTVGGGGTPNDATFTLTSISFRIHNDTRQNFSITRNDDSMSTTLTSTVSSIATVIPVTDETLLHTTTPTVESPQVAWIGTERIVYHGVNAAANEISGCIRGSAGTSAQTHSIGSKVFGTEDQTVPGQNIFWVDSLTANYHSGAAATWRYTGAPNVFFTDTTDATIHSGTSVVVGDALRVTSGTLINKSYLITDLILDGEVARIDVTTPGTGYVVGDIVLLTGLGGAVGATAEVGGVDVNGGITYITITNRGTAGVSSLDSIGITSGGGDAFIDVFYNTEGLVLTLTGDIINPNGVVVEDNFESWEIDRLNPGGLSAATTAAAVFLQAEPGNALPITISP